MLPEERVGCRIGLWGASDDGGGLAQQLEQRRGQPDAEDRQHGDQQGHGRHQLRGVCGPAASFFRRAQQQVGDVAEQAAKDLTSAAMNRTLTQLRPAQPSRHDAQLSQEDSKRRQARNADDGQGEQNGRGRHRLEQPCS